MGVLAGVEDATGFDLRRCEYFVGTSAGAIVAAHLVAGERPRRPIETGSEIEPARPQPVTTLATVAQAAARRAGGWALAAGASFAPLALGISAPGGAVLRATMLRRLPRPTTTLDHLASNIERTGARFDGRLRIVAVDRRGGKRVVFGSPGAPRATVAQAVAASCSIPWLFAPVRDRRPRLCRRRRVEREQPRRRAGRPGYPRALFEPDGEPVRVADDLLGSAPCRPHRRVVGVDGAAPPRRRGPGRGAERRVHGDDGGRLHGPGAAGPRARGRVPAGVGAGVTGRVRVRHD